MILTRSWRDMRVPGCPETTLISARRVTPSAHGSERRNTFCLSVEDMLEMFSPSWLALSWTFSRNFVFDFTECSRAGRRDGYDCFPKKATFAADFTLGRRFLFALHSDATRIVFLFARRYKVETFSSRTLVSIAFCLIQLWSLISSSAFAVYGLAIRLAGVDGRITSLVSSSSTSE